MLLSIWPASGAQADGSVPRVEHNLYTLDTAGQALRRLQAPASFWWENKPLRDGIAELSRAHGVDVWLDRRLDPLQEVSARFPGRSESPTVASALELLARSVGGAAAGLVENVVYFGPLQSVARVQCAAALLYDQMHPSARPGSADAVPLQWADISSYREVLDSIERQSEWSITGDLPHDLLHAGQLTSPSALATQLALLLAGFDLTAETIEGRRLRLVPLGARTDWRYTYRAGELSAAHLTASWLQGLRRRFPASRVDRRPQGWEVAGPTDLHLALLSPPARREAAAPSNWARMRWTFEVRNKPAKGVLDSLAATIGFNTHWTPAALSHRDRLISFDVANADLDRLLAAFARASGLRIDRQGTEVQVDVPQSR